VAAATYAARHMGHLGMRRRTAVGASQGADRRAFRGAARQHWAFTMGSPRWNCSRRRP
jgi:hypothetical protein